MIQTMKRYIPSPLRRGIGSIRNLPAWVDASLSSFEKGQNGHLSLNYLGMAPTESEIAHGGRVKLLYLNRAFPEKTAANIVYAESSALPNFPGTRLSRAKRNGLKVVLNQNGVAYPAWAGNDYHKINSPLRAALKSADFIAYKSEFCRVSANRFLGKPSVPWQIVHNAIDLDRFSPLDEPLPDSPFIVLLGGNQCAKYRLETALDAIQVAASEIPDIILHISGKVDWTGDEAACIKTAEEMIAKPDLKDRVKLLGPFLQKDAPDVYRSAHVLLHTNYNDACATAVIEAMGCGLPVVYSESGGLPELVDSESGVGITIEITWEQIAKLPAERWAEATVAARKNIDSLRLGARRRAEDHFGLDAWIEKRRSIYHEVLS